MRRHITRSLPKETPARCSVRQQTRTERPELRSSEASSEAGAPQARRGVPQARSGAPQNRSRAPQIRSEAGQIGCEGPRIRSGAPKVRSSSAPDPPLSTSRPPISSARPHLGSQDPCCELLTENGDPRSDFDQVQTSPELLPTSWLQRLIPTPAPHTSTSPAKSVAKLRREAERSLGPPVPNASLRLRREGRAKPRPCRPQTLRQRSFTRRQK